MGCSPSRLHPVSVGISDRANWPGIPEGTHYGLPHGLPHYQMFAFQQQLSAETYLNADLLLPPPYSEVAPDGHVSIEGHHRCSETQAQRNAETNAARQMESLAISTTESEEQNAGNGSSFQDVLAKPTTVLSSSTRIELERSRTALSMSSSTDIAPPTRPSLNWPTRIKRNCSDSNSPPPANLQAGSPSPAENPSSPERITLPAGTERYRRKRLRRRAASSRSLGFNAVDRGDQTKRKVSEFSYHHQVTSDVASQEVVGDGSAAKESLKVFQFGGAKRLPSLCDPTSVQRRTSWPANTASHLKIENPVTEKPISDVPSLQPNRSQTSPFKFPDFAHSRLPPIRPEKRSLGAVKTPFPRPATTPVESRQLESTE